MWIIEDQPHPHYFYCEICNVVDSRNKKYIGEEFFWRDIASLTSYGSFICCDCYTDMTEKDNVDPLAE